MICDEQLELVSAESGCGIKCEGKWVHRDYIDGFVCGML